MVRRRVNHSVWVASCVSGMLIYLTVSFAMHPLVVAFVPLYIVQVVVSSFAVKTVCSAIVIALIPGDLTRCNSEFFSGVATPPSAVRSCMPQVVVHVPVYDEPLAEVIAPTLLNAAVAVREYRDAGGSSKIMVFDDGLLTGTISEAERRSRLDFYRTHDVTYVARPVLGRAGLFKKASNMNFALELICHPDRLADPDRDFAWGGDVSMDDDALILLLDADSRVPPLCMIHTVPEFVESPELPFIQHCQMPFEEHDEDYVQRMIGHFTETIYKSGILIGTCLGDTAPLVGHSAFVRWSAMREVKPPGPHGTFWTERHVSEDFELSLRFMVAGRFGRYATYAGDGFREGISLTYIDEIAKWSKFSYGSAEMLFNPVAAWLTEGVFSRLIVDLVSARSVRWYQKVNMLVYLSSFFAMSTCFYLVLVEFVAYSCLGIEYTRFHNLDVVLACVLVFAGCGTAGEIVSSWKRDGFSLAVIPRQLRWTAHLSLFFGSLLFHTTTSMFAYFAGTRPTWGATRKTATGTTRACALATTVWHFRFTFAVMVAMIVLPAAMRVYAPGMWIYGTFHVAGPIMLNPSIVFGRPAARIKGVVPV